ncbi:SDR family oxidoreductase [Planococcus sp. MB-3u-03]|uniref:SDR family oxidoreductase n=1 Tax=Planococcus sp. MB-3u-03 TaxID=2058136 RepID=UPI0018E2FB35|nr:SDR family oxidoreductase [Planococcus sp. MB-3u-03]
MANEKILITGAGTGFGKNIAFSLAEKGKSVIAGVEIISQVSALEQEAKERGVSMQIEKLDVTNPKDREKAWGWDIDVLVNNAAVSEGGSLVDIPEENLRHQFEVNVFGPVLLTKGFARQMVERKSGRIVFVSSVSGLMADPLMGPYCGTKHATEAFADSLSKELQEFNVEVATINPGPYLTGFNDREFETWKTGSLIWKTQSSTTRKPLSLRAIRSERSHRTVGKSDSWRDESIPQRHSGKMIPQVKERMEAMWSKTTTEGLGERDETVQKSYEIEPGTPAE